MARRPMTAPAATRLTERIVAGRAEQATMLAEARDGQAWRALGFTSLEAWLADCDEQALQVAAEASGKRRPPRARRAAQAGQPDPNPPTVTARTARGAGAREVTTYFKGGR